MIVLCSANEKIRQRWREGLTGFPDLREVDGLDELERLLDEDPPQLVVMHLGLPGLDGATGVVRLRQRYPQPKFLVLSDVPAEDEGFALLRNGVRGYANTYSSPAHLSEAVKVIALGDIWLGSQLLRNLVAELAHVHPVAQASGSDSSRLGAQPLPSVLSRLTTREREIVTLLARGESNKRIAANLGITERTVKAHLSSIFQKTGFKDRLHLALAMNHQRAADDPKI